MRPKVVWLIVVLVAVVLTAVLVYNISLRSQQQPEQREVTLRFLHYSAEYNDAFEAVARAFEEKKPGVKVIVEVITTDYNAVLKSRDASNQLPDIFMASTAGEPALKPYIEAKKIQPVGDLKVISQLSQAIRDSITFSDGQIYLIPITNSVRGIIYNRALFEKLGLKKPETFSELKEVARVLKQNGIVPFALAAKDGWTLGSNIFQLGQELFSSKEWLERRWRKEAKFSENVLPIFDFIDFVVANANEDFAVTDYITSLSLVANEKAAMVIQGNFALPEIFKMNPAMENTLGFMAVPFTDDPDKTRLYLDTNNYAVVNSKTDLNLVDEFFDFLINSDEAKELFWAKLKPISPYGASYDLNSPLTEVYGYIDSGKVIANYQYNNMPDGMWQVYATAMQEYIVNKVSREKVLSIIEEGFDRLAQGVE